MEVKKMPAAFRVIHIIGGGEFGGAEDHIIHLLRELRQEGVESEVVCFYDSTFAKFLREQGVTVEVLNYGRFDIRLLFGLIKILKDKKPDIVHTHGVKANFFGRIAAKKAGISSIVTTVHSILKYDYEHPIAYRLAKILENSTRKSTDYFIAISNNIKDQLIEEGVTPSKIQIIYHGIDTNKFAPKEDGNAQALAEQCGKTAHTFLIGAIGRLQTVKGFNYFIEACAQLHNKHPNSFRFLLIGEGPQREELEKLVKLRGLNEIFYFTGFRENVDSCLRALDCYVSSSLSEGLGLSVIEALSTGVPVVTTEVGGVKDFARHEENALVVEPQNVDQLVSAIERIRDDSEVVEKLKKQGMEDIRNSFSLDKMGKNTAFYYKKWVQTNK